LKRREMGKVWRKMIIDGDFLLALEEEGRVWD